ncbi:hypothetical protein [Schlesneria sp.]|uniref:hypothetical protein n=1 Tax=Schlesneria sp. TaxID=2762018 RepID=UPI002F10509E
MNTSNPLLLTHFAGRATVFLLFAAIAASVPGGQTPSSATPSSEEVKPTTTLPADLRAHDVEGHQHQLLGSAELKGIGLVFLTHDTASNHELLQRLNKLATVYRKQNVTLYGVYLAPNATRKHARDEFLKFRPKFPVLFDARQSLRKLTGATHSQQAFVYDRGGKLIYRGRLDDAATTTGKKSSSKKNYLVDALQAVAHGKRLAVTQTDPAGEPLAPLTEDESSSTILFTRDVAPILFSNCVNCHREGEVAPFPLLTYDQVRTRAQLIVEVVNTRLMPPWKPAPNYGHFAGERRLSQEQLETLQAWYHAETPEGDDDDLPPVPTFPKGWQLGKPDMVIRMPRRFALPADGPDLYKHFVIPTGLHQDRLIRAIEVHPGNPRIVHHAHMFLDNSGQARSLDEADPTEGYTRFGGHGLPEAAYLGGWNPGATPHFFPKGMGRLMPKGGDVVFQIHYHPSGKPEFDQTEIGIYFAPSDARQMITDLIVGNVDLVIPADEPDVRFKGEYVTPVSLLVLEVRPHMHLLGKSYLVRAILPSGAEVPLLKIEEWDFNWQDSYVVDPVVHLPAGSRIQIEVAFDNSSGNPANPNIPPQTVYFGEESTDEMCNCNLRVTADTYAEFQKIVTDNGAYWSREMQKYLSRNRTPDRKIRESQ